MMVSPVPMAAPMAVATPGVMMAGAAPGYYRTENVGTYCGPITILIGIFIFPFVCCCPCDQRQVWTPTAVMAAVPTVAAVAPMMAAPMMAAPVMAPPVMAPPVMAAPMAPAAPMAVAQPQPGPIVKN
ncbi:hypothetical protein NFJ02_21g44980 [Pycnococcus provasolii]